MKRLLTIVCAAVTLTACHHHEEEVQQTADRTVLIYMAGENDLSAKNQDFASSDLKQMKAGSKNIPENNHLVVFVDRASNSENPYLMEIGGGEAIDSIAFEQDMKTSDPETLLNIFRKTMEKYPANEYALVLWGHASGWLIEKDSVASDIWNTPDQSRVFKAYGRDTGNNRSESGTGTWMNIPSMARTLGMLPKLKYIFADCCHFQCAESAYELRNVADYIIASPAEIPGEGAPYQNIVPALFDKDNFWKQITDIYYQQVIVLDGDNLREPLSVVKTGEMEQLAQATRNVLATFLPMTNMEYPDMNGLIHYYYHGSDYKFYDMNDFILKYATADAYTTWKQAFDRAVIYRKWTDKWMTNVNWGWYYADFTVTEERYGGMSMFVPQWYYQTTINKNIKNMAWYYAAGLADIGW